MGREIKRSTARQATGTGGAAGWLVSRLLGRLRGRAHSRPRLALLEKITLAPRQSLALVEADGKRFLIATSTDGSPAIFALNDRAGSAAPRSASAARVSW